MSFCNEVENDLGPGWLNEWEWKRPDPCGFGRAVWSSASAHLSPAVTRPAAWGRGSRGSVEESELEKGVLELEEELSSKLMFYLTSTAESHSTEYCYYGKARTLSTCVSGSKYVLYACMHCMHDVPYVSMHVSGAVFHGLGLSLRSSSEKSSWHSTQNILDNGILHTLWQQSPSVSCQCLGA